MTVFLQKQCCWHFIVPPNKADYFTVGLSILWNKPNPIWKSFEALWNCDLYCNSFNPSKWGPNFIKSIWNQLCPALFTLNCIKFSKIAHKNSFLLLHILTCRSVTASLQEPPTIKEKKPPPSPPYVKWTKKTLLYLKLVKFCFVYIIAFF